MNSRAFLPQVTLPVAPIEPAAAAPPPAVPWRQLRAEAVGRGGELAKALQFFSDEKANTLAMSGPPGCGKLAFAHEAIRSAGRTPSTVEVDGQWTRERHEMEMRRLGATNLDGCATTTVFVSADLATAHECWAQSPVKKVVVFSHLPARLAHGGPRVLPLRLYPLSDKALRKVVVEQQLALHPDALEQAVSAAMGDLRQLQLHVNFLHGAGARVDMCDDGYQIARSILVGKCKFDRATFDFRHGDRAVIPSERSADVLFENYLDGARNVEHAAQLAADVAALPQADLPVVLGAHGLRPLRWSAWIRTPCRAQSSGDPYRLVWPDGASAQPAAAPADSAVASPAAAPADSAAASPAAAPADSAAASPAAAPADSAVASPAAAPAPGAAASSGAPATEPVEPAKVLLESKLHMCSLQRTDAYERDGAVVCTAAGGNVKNHGRGRHWLLVESTAGVAEAFQTLAPLFAAVHAFADERGTVCLIYKTNRQGLVKLGEPYCLRAVPTGTTAVLKAEHVLQLFQETTDARCRAPFSALTILASCDARSLACCASNSAMRDLLHAAIRTSRCVVSGVPRVWRPAGAAATSRSSRRRGSLLTCRASRTRSRCAARQATPETTGAGCMRTP